MVWTLEFNEKEGKFYHRGEKKSYYEKGQDLVLLIKNIPIPANCKIVKKTKKVEYFEKVCSQE